MEMIVDCGVDINDQEMDGYTALFSAIHYNHHSAVAFLLEFKADDTILYNHGQSILHIAARHSDSRMRQILADTDMWGLDIDAVDENEKMARDIFLSEKSWQLSDMSVSGFYEWTCLHELTS